MNQSEFDKLIVEVQKLAKFGSYIYGMKLYEVFPYSWLAFMRNTEQLAIANMKIKDGSFKMESCCN
tara:strand:- start:735 stop:932 length:198 start_codon:yes stop_codon:yes gene_type:complete